MREYTLVYRQPGGVHVRVVATEAMSADEARAAGDRQNERLSFKNATPLYDFESIEAAPIQRRWWNLNRGRNG